MTRLLLPALLLFLCDPLSPAELGPPVSRPPTFAIRWTGAASYYHRALEGRKTASGRRYRGRELTCATRRVPFGTVLLVTRLDNGRSVLVENTDRFSAGDPPERIVDLSREAGRRLGMLRDGLANVSVTARSK